MDDSSFSHRSWRFSSVFSGQHVVVCAAAATAANVSATKTRALIRSMELNFFTIDVHASQPGRGCLRRHRSVVHLLEGVRLCSTAGEDRQDLDVPVIVLVDRFPVLQST